jgi:hypothetical protein
LVALCELPDHHGIRKRCASDYLTVRYASPPREDRSMTTIHTENPFPNVPMPPGAVQVDDWCDSTDSATRYFEGRTIEVDWPPSSRCHPGKAIQVFVAGIQYADGRIDPKFVVHQLHSNYLLKDAGAARQLARAIMAAADEFDRLT